MAWQYGVGQTLTVVMYQGGVPTAPTGTVALTISKAGGAFGAAAGTAVQIGTTPAVRVSLTDADCTCADGCVCLTDGGGTAEPRYVEFCTEGSYTAARATAIDTIAADVANIDGATMYDPAGTGANTVTVTVATAGGVVYEGIRVSCTNAAETASPLVQYTDSSGQVTYHLDAGPWRIIAATTAAQSGGHTDVTVDGAESVTVTVTAANIPAATSADNYLLYGYERKVEGDAAFGAAGVTVQVLRIDAAGQTDATANACRRIMGTSYSTDASGLWSMEIAKALADARLTLKFSWTDAAGATRTETWQGLIAASAANATDQIAWADLALSKQA